MIDNCFCCDKDKEGSDCYLLRVCDECKKEWKLPLYEQGWKLGSKCSFCEEDAQEKGTVYRGLVVCCDCYVGPVKLREEYKEKLKAVELREERCNEMKKSNSQWAKELKHQQEFALSRFGISIACLLILFALYAIFHGEHLTNCFLCRWRWALVVVGVVSFYWAGSIIADREKTN